MLRIQQFLAETDPTFKFDMELIWILQYSMYN